jgi:hypothetical protein
MELYPIDIPPLKVKHSGQTYTCAGDGLHVFGCGFDPHVASTLQALEPARTPTGRIAKRQPRVPDHARHGINWWKAQCIFRGLPYKGLALKILQDNLRDAAGRKRLPGLDEMEKRLNREFLTKNSAAREEKSQKESGKSWKEAEAERERAEYDRAMRIMEAKRLEAERRMEEKWKTLSTQEKAAKYPRRFLEETFPSGGPEKEAIVFKTISRYPRQQLESDAKGLGLCTQSIDAPNVFDSGDGESSNDNSASSDDDPENSDGNSESSDEDSDRWIVIGRSMKHVTAKIKDIKQKLVRERHQLQAAQTDDVRRGRGWDITGSWRIRWPSLEKDYKGGNLTMDIYRDTSTGSLQMYARFDFRVVEGILRFEKPGAATPVFDRLKPRTEEGWYEDEDEDEDEDRNDDDDENFQLGPTDKPSPQNPTWNFRWRGKETGEGVIELYSEERLCSMTFSGTGGCKVTGTFHNEYVEDCEFSGVKVSAEPRRGRFDIRGAWSDHNENAYERARVGRWH